MASTGHLSKGEDYEKSFAQMFYPFDDYNIFYSCEHLVS